MSEEQPPAADRGDLIESLVTDATELCGDLDAAADLIAGLQTRMKRWKETAERAARMEERRVQELQRACARQKREEKAARERLVEAGVAVYPSIERAALAMRRFVEFWEEHGEGERPG